MMARDGKRNVERTAAAALAAVVALTSGTALGQSTAKTAPARKGAAPASTLPSAGKAAQAKGEAINPVVAAIPVNPTDAIAVVNGEAISRQQLADECVARKGQEILETLIARKLLQQAMKAKGLDVTADEVDKEIIQVAARTGISRDGLLMTLEKEKGISPVMYARDVIYPTIGLRKLATPKVQVTDKDLEIAAEANYGPKIKCRIIMVSRLREAQEIWEELKKNPGNFEKLAQTRSNDHATRSLGGLLPEPISRHASPLSVSEGAFKDLYDVDPKDTQKKYAPKDGDYTGPIQIEEDSYVLLQRVGVIPPEPVDIKNKVVRDQLKAVVYDAKLQQAMREVFEDLTDKAQIDNALTGKTKVAQESRHPDVQGVVEPDADKVTLMSKPGTGTPPKPASVDGAVRAASTPPVGVNADDVRRMEALKKPPAKPAATPAPTPAPSGGN